jgi:MoaA/NifB/PqqE/SkfB family radical SAM enzyme
MQLNNQFNHPVFHWHLELSSKCALRCPRCPRTRYQEMFKPSELSLEFIQSVFSPGGLAVVERILICGGEGDPIYCSDFIKIIRYFKETKPSLSLAIVTNGSYRKEEWWMQVAEILNEYDTVTFSVDGWDQESNSKYRVNCDWDSIVLGVKTMSRSKARINWSTIVFSFNEEQLDFIEETAKSLGADYFSTVNSTLFGSKNKKFIDPELGFDPLEPIEKSVSPIQRHMRAGRLLSSKQHKKNGFRELYKEWFVRLERESKDWYILPLCRFGDRALYINAEGFLHACSWVSHPFSEMRVSDHRPFVQTSWHNSWAIKNRPQFDLKVRGIDEVLNDTLWIELLESWKTSGKTDVTCEEMCLRSEVKWQNLRFSQ